MTHFSLEIYFRKADETLLNIDIQEIEISPDMDSNGFIYFGVGSTFSYQEVQYRILDLETRYFRPVSGYLDQLEQTDAEEGTHVKVLYVIEPTG